MSYRFDVMGSHPQPGSVAAPAPQQELLLPLCARSAASPYFCFTISLTIGGSISCILSPIYGESSEVPPACGSPPLTMWGRAPSPVQSSSARQIATTRRTRLTYKSVQSPAASPPDFACSTPHTETGEAPA